MDMQLYLSMQSQILEKMDTLIDMMKKQETKRREDVFPDFLFYILAAIFIIYIIHIFRYV